MTPCPTPKPVRRAGLFAAALIAAAAPVNADPLLDSWFTQNSGLYARVYETTSAQSSGTTSTTWTDQSLPVYSDIQAIQFSNNWVYVQYSGLSSHVMGPWLNPQGGQFQFWPVNQQGIRRFPRNPVVQSGTKDATSGGYSGLWANGVAVFNALDGKAWDGSQIQGQSAHTQSTYYWHRNAPVAEGFNFDPAMAHQPPSGIYHTHQNPLGLRYQLGDHVDYDAEAKTYSESDGTPSTHSPILGFAHDGYPIYGPYGYSDPNDANSGIRRMIPGYVKRDGSNGTDSVSSNRSTIPAWYARYRQAHFGETYSTTAGDTRAAVNTTYPLGTFAQDWAYLGDLSNPAADGPYVQGVDFDLDTYNGRFCVTPEYPEGTYAYFTAIDSSGEATYPYVFGFEFYGDATGGSVNTITESVTTQFVGGPQTALDLESPEIDGNTDEVTLTWSSVEGGTYLIESSNDESSWNTEQSGVNSGGSSTSTAFTDADGAGFARVTRTALASYDEALSTSFTSTQTDTESYAEAVTVWYVNAARTGQATQDGTSWSTAFADLQDALASATAGDEIWVAAGIYYPDESEAGLASVTGDYLGSHFPLIADVGIYGGFTGSETLRSERDPSSHITILSGDIDHETNPDTTVGGIVVSDPENNILGTNADSVIQGVWEGAASVDGFTITSANGFALAAGGTFRNCTFQGNRGATTGVIFASSAPLTLIDCGFYNNYSLESGVIRAGDTGFGSGANLTINGCAFQGNESSGSGAYVAGVARITGGSATFRNSLISGNVGGDTGAIFLEFGGTLTVQNTTIAGNYAKSAQSAEAAGAIMSRGGGDISIQNSIIWGNHSTASTQLYGTIAPFNSLIEGLNPGGSNLDGSDPANDPTFLSPITASETSTKAGDFRLNGMAAPVGAGDVSLLPADTLDRDQDGDTSENEPLDFAGSTRVIGTLDIGAYEYTGPTVTGSVAANYDVGSSSGDATLLNLATVFGESGLTYQVSSSAIAVATVSTSGDSLIVTPVGNPSETTTISVTATDADGNRTTITFTVTLIEEISTDPAYSLTQNLASWHTTDSARYARIYPTYAAEQAGAAVTTWDNGTYAQTIPAYAGVQEINHDADYVYIRTTGLSAGHVMGPWYNDTGIGGSLEPFSNWPEAIQTIYRIPVQPVIPASKTTYGAGAIGLMIDGTVIFSESDTFSWDNDEDGTGNGSDTEPGPGSGGNGDGLWLHDAYLTEGNTFDKSNAHSAGNQIHYHASPMKLRHLLGDSVDAVQQPDGSFTYQESFNGTHSPILGWMNDGIPLYGPYGYSDAMDPESGVRRMVSGFIVRNGENGSYDTAANGRTVIPAWSARYRGRGTACTINEQGPTTATLDVPYFMEDYDYLGDLTNPADGQPYEQGVDFDLNEFNCRFCVTPEFPEGTWAYFVSIGADGNPAFPYNVGAQYYGDPSDGGGITELPAAVTQTFLGGPDIAESNRSSRMENGDIVITWNVAEGGSYNIRTSENLSAWDDAPSDTVAVDNTLTVADPVTSGVPAKFYQITRTGLATYDDGSGGGGGGGGGGNTVEGIQSVTPNSGSGSQTVTIVFDSAAMVPPAAVAPDSVTIGTVAGTSVSRNSTSGNITATFNLSSLTDGAYTVTVNFTTPDGALSVTGTNLFTVSSGGGGGGEVVTHAFTFATSPPLPQQGEITSAKVGTVDATITSYNSATGAVSMQFDNSTLASGNHSATFTFVPTAGPQAGNTVTRTSTNQYTKP